MLSLLLTINCKTKDDRIQLLLLNRLSRLLRQGTPCPMGEEGVAIADYYLIHSLTKLTKLTKLTNRFMVTTGEERFFSVNMNKY